MVITKHTQDMGADSGQLSVQIHGSDSDPWIGSMDQIHGSNSWIESMDLERKLARISSHILCVLGNYHMSLLATKTSFRR